MATSAQDHSVGVGDVHDPVSRAWHAFEREGDALIVRTRLEPGGNLPPHWHPRQEERWSVLEGEVRFRLGEDERVLSPADGEVVVAPGTVHGLRSCSDHDARLRCVVSPPLHLQEFLTEAAGAAERGLFTREGRPRGLRGVRWAAAFLKRHRDETVMASPPAIVQRMLIATLARRTPAR